MKWRGMKEARRELEGSRVIATEQLEVGIQYVKVAVGDTDDRQTTEHDSSSNIASYFTEGTKQC